MNMHKAKASVIFASLLVFSQNAPGRDLPSFSQIDADGSGQLSRREVLRRGAGAIDAFFDRYDSDKNGELDNGEFTAAAAHLEWRVKRGPAFANHPPSFATPGDFKSALDTFREHHELEGAALIVGTERGPALEAYSGSYGPETVINIASASKWFTGIIIATVARETGLRLSDQLSSWQPTLAGTPLGSATLAQLISFTAGGAAIGTSPESDLALPPTISFEEAAQRLMQYKLVADPGTTFAYGSWTMQLGGIWAASRAGEGWQALQDRIISKPLSLSDSHWGYLAREPGTVTNPNLQGGLWTSPRDLVKFISAVQAKRKLDPWAIDRVEQVMTRGLARGLSPPEAEGMDFGLGVWCERADPEGQCRNIQSTGAWGTSIWVNRDTGIWGVFFVFDRGPRVSHDRAVFREAAEAYVSKHVGSR
jgi:CubicO group peptidase (beta-lactamase class C family)